MKNKYISLFLVAAAMASAQHTITGEIKDGNSGNPVPGISVALLPSGVVTVTDEKGAFRLTTAETEVVISVAGGAFAPYTEKLTLPLKEPLQIGLFSKTTTIEEVGISTGYQKIPKERSTGSFSLVNEKALNQQVTTNIMDRLEAIANGVVVDRGTTDLPKLTVRGLSTINGPREPLIVLDDFPYEGNLSNINPNMVESITVLKDAAASSIWGARAANGVIVITTKKGKWGQPLQIDFNANTSISGKPDLGYIKQMSSTDFIGVEKRLFSQGFYDSDINSPAHPVLTPVVDILNQERNGSLSAAQAEQMIKDLQNIDTRDQYTRYMYRTRENRQYALNLSGGSQKMSWVSGLGYDDNTGNLGETYQRINLRMSNTWKISEKWTVQLGGLFTRTDEKSGRSGYGSIGYSGSWRVPYLSFADQQGNPVAVPFIYNQNYLATLQNSGLLDWKYYPLTDWQHRPITSENTEIIINSGIHYKIIPGLEADIKYQYQQTALNNEQLYTNQSYYARNYVNTFAQMGTAGNVIFKVPKGGILDTDRSAVEIHNIRGQLNFNRTWNRHNVSAIAGAETRETQTEMESNRSYGYNPNTRAFGNVDLTTLYPNLVTGGLEYIISGKSMRTRNSRFASLYSNAAYTFDRKYTLSGSIRRDASNLFGLKTNDQWNPFWSVGAAWNISEEKFLTIAGIPELRLRASYGFNGNIDPSMVAVTTIFYDSALSPYTGTAMARIDQYYNPNLQWETSRIINLGLDFSVLNRRISGAVEWFTKKGTNLFGNAPLDYTTGISSMLMNVAGMKGHGLDVELKTDNLRLKHFNWVSTINFSQYKDEITDYYLANTFASNFVSNTGSVVPVSGSAGKPVYAIFAYRWAGLDPETGDPLGYLNGEISKDYTAITGSDKGIEDLKYFGSAIPTVYGTFNNSWSYRNFSLDVGLTYKLGYWFRRSSISYTNLINSRVGHSDYALRWQNPGDELHTDIPSELLTSNSARDQFFLGSEVLVEKGDHVRWQYLTVNYSLDQNNLWNLPIKKLSVYGSVNNLGLVWKANKAGMDPDYSFGNESLKPVTTYSVGFRAHF